MPPTLPLFSDQYDRIGYGVLEDSHMTTPFSVTRMIEVPNGRGGFTKTPTTFGPFWCSYSPVVNVTLPRVVEDQAQGRIIYWLKYPLGVDIQPDDEIVIDGRVYTLATEYDPPPNPRVQIAVMWRKQD